jgi:putative phage-type endonuclease
MSAATLELPTPQQIDDERKAAWLAERRTCITGTDIAAIFGLNKWTSPIEVWLSKKSQIEKPDNDAMFFGRKFERPILEAYSERLGVPIEFAQPWTLIRVPGCPLLGASLDARWLNGDRRPVDAKNTRFKSPLWGDNGSDVFPVYYQLQLAVQMMATETQAADLAVCFSGSEFGRYSMVSDPEVEDSIRERALDWWNKHVVADVPPEPDGSESYGNYLKAKFKRSSEITRPVTAQVREWAEALRVATERMKEAEAEKLKAENLLKSYMGDASAIPGIATWKNNKDSETTDWRAVVSELATLIDGAKVACIIEANTSTKPGARVFRPSK